MLDVALLASACKRCLNLLTAAPPAHAAPCPPCSRCHRPFPSGSKPKVSPTQRMSPVLSGGVLDSLDVLAAVAEEADDAGGPRTYSGASSGEAHGRPSFSVPASNHQQLPLARQAS